VTELHFDFRDVFRAARLGLSGKKMGVSFLGILVAYVCYLVLTYAALLSSGLGWGTIWRAYRLFPLAMVDKFAWYSWVIYGVGVFFAVVVLLLTATAVAKISYQQLKGDDFYSMGDSRKFVAKHWKAAILSPIGILGMVVVLFIMAIILGLLGRIPYVGELGFSIISPLIFGGAFLTLFVALVLGVSLILSPAITATTGEDTVETITQSFSTIWSQPWRFVTYQGWLAFTLGLSSWVFAIFTVNALGLMQWFPRFFMGNKLAVMTKEAIAFAPTCKTFNLILSKIPYFHFFLPDFSKVPDAGGTVLVSGVIGGIMLILVIFFALSYSFATWSAGQTLIYLVLRKKKDNENLLERKEEEEEKEEEKEEKKEEVKEEEAAPKEEKKEEKKEGTAPKEEKKQGKKE